MLDRTIAPVAGKISNINFAKAKTTSLSNGIPVHIINAGQHDIVRLEIILKSGKWYERANGTAYFTSQMLLEGTSHMTSRELAEKFEFNGAHVNINFSIDLNILVVYVINSKLSEIIGIIKDCLLNSTFSEEELAVLKDIKKQKIRINYEKNSFVATREVRKLLYGQAHPYGRALEVDEIDQGLSREQLTEYFRQDLLSGIEIIISGKISDPLIESLQTFNDLPVMAPQDKLWDIKAGGNSDKVIPKKDSLQSSIRLGRRIIPKTHPDFTGMIVLNEIFGGFFGSRLMKNIREDKGYTYGIHSSIVSHLQDSFWMVGTDVKKEFADDTIDQIYFEAERLRNETVGAEELKVVRNYMMGNFLSSLETSFSLADKFKNIYFFGQDYSFYDRYIETINTITAQEIQELAIKYMDKLTFKQVVVG